MIVRGTCALEQAEVCRAGAETGPAAFVGEGRRGGGCVSEGKTAQTGEGGNFLHDGEADNKLD